jgi:hypothetical protein
MERKMFKNKPVTLLIASALMLVVVILAGVLPLFGGNPGMGFNSGRFPNGQGNFDPSRMPEGFTNRDGAPLPEGINPGDRPNFQGNSSGAMPTNNTNMKLIQLLRGLQTGMAIIIAVMGLLSVVGILLGKNWGRILAIITAIIVIVLTLTSFSA